MFEYSAPLETPQAPCQSQCAGITFLLGQALAEVARQTARAERAEAELAKHHAITANQDMTTGQKQVAHIVTEYLEHRAPYRPNEPRHPERFPIADVAKLYGVSNDSLGKGLKQLDEMGYIDRHEEPAIIAGQRRTVVSVARGDLYDTPEDLSPEIVKNGHGGRRWACPECQCENLIIHATCKSCGTMFKIGEQHAHDDEPQPDSEPLAADGEKQPDPTPRPAPVPFPTRPAPQPAPMPKAAYSTPCSASPVGVHEYAAMRSPDGRRVCVECGQPEPRTELH